MGGARNDRSDRGGRRVCAVGDGHRAPADRADFVGPRARGAISAAEAGDRRRGAWAVRAAHGLARPVLRAAARARGVQSRGAEAASHAYLPSAADEHREGDGAMSVDLALLYVHLALSGGVIALGLAIMLGGALGMLRFPDFYTRLHAQNAGDGVGGVIVLVGMLIASPNQDFAIRLALLAVLWAVVHPTFVEMQAKAAHSGGLSPIAGPYAARGRKQ